MQLTALVVFYKVSQFHKTGMKIMMQKILDNTHKLLQKLRQRCLHVKKFNNTAVMLPQIFTKWMKLVLDALILTMKVFNGHKVV